MKSENVLKFPVEKPKDIGKLERLARFFEAQSGRKSIQAAYYFVGVSVVAYTFCREACFVERYRDKYVKLKL